MTDPNAILATPEGLVGHTLADRYQVQKLLGDGGMGSVYLAEHVTLRKRVAIKVLHQELCRDKTQVDRFLQEARAASMIGHENIVDIVDFGPVPGGSVFFAMEFLEGEDLADLLRREGRLPWSRARGLILQVLRALAAAHTKGIIHRDLKPANCFLVKRSDGRDFVKVLDFGIAKVTGEDSDGGGLTRTGAVFGTAKYMAPEQACGETADNRTDVYAAAICLYEFMTGTVPYDGDNFMRVLSQHLTEPLTPPTTKAPDADISPAVEAIIVKALSKRREDRYQSMEAFAEAVEAIGLDGNLAGAAYEGPMAVGHGQAQPNAGNTMWLPDARPPSHPPEEPRGGTLLLDPDQAPDLEFGTVKLDGPHGWDQQQPQPAARPASVPPQGAAPVAAGVGTNPPHAGGHAGLATTPPMPDTSPATAAPGGGDYTMFATETRSTGKFVALLVAGAIVAIGGGGLAAWLLLGDDGKEDDDKVVVADKPDKSEKPDKPEKKKPEPDPTPEPKGLEIDDPPPPPEPDPTPEPEVKDPPPEPDPTPEPETKTASKPPRNNRPRNNRPRNNNRPKADAPKAKLTSGQVRSGFGKATASVKACKGAIPGMKVKIRADIKPDGSVMAARATGGGAPANVAKCAVNAVKSKAKFAATTSHQAESHTFSF